jgi:hypothetical protein
MSIKSIIRMSGLCLFMAAVARHGWRCKNALAGVYTKQKLLSLLLAWMLITMTCASTER